MRDLWRVSVNRDELNLTYVSLGLIYPPLPRFTGTQLPDLYAKLCKRHDFEAFERHGDESANFLTEGQREITLDREKIIVEDTSARDFDIVRRDVSDIIEVVKQHLSIPLFFTPRIQLRARWPLSDPESQVSEVLREKVMKLADDQLDFLGVAALHGIGLTIKADIQEGNHIELEVRPSQVRSDMIFIDLTNIRHDQVDTVQVMEQRLREAHEYLRGPVAKFIETFMP